MTRVCKQGEQSGYFVALEALKEALNEQGQGRPGTAGGHRRDLGRRIARVVQERPRRPRARGTVLGGLDAVVRARVDGAEDIVGLTRGDGYNVVRLERGCAAMAMDAVKYNIAMLDGPACTSSRCGPGHVLRATGLSDDEANGCARISWCHLTSGWTRGGRGTVSKPQVAT